MASVKFIALENKKSICDCKDYVEDIFSSLYKLGCVEEYQMLTNDSTYRFLGEVEKDKVTFFIEFLFETFKDAKQLSVDISSEEYELDVINECFEDLKMHIKNSVGADWKKIVWIYDDDAYMLSKDLYSRFYVTENNIRRFINEFMVKVFGPEWWDQLSVQSIKDKYKARYLGYKTVVPGFNNIDDHLISIDVGDLYKILTMKKQGWAPQHDEEIEKLLSGVTEGNERRIVERIKKQLFIKEDYWEKYFKHYFDEDFSKCFGEFEANRNHVAHNKILDRTAYKSIRKSIEKMDGYMNDALDKLYKNNKSLEQLQTENRKYEQLLLITKQRDSGVTIRNEDRIIEEFKRVLDDKYYDIVNAFRFRDDIDISELSFNPDENSGKLFSASSKVTGNRLDFTYSLDIYEDEGAESILAILCEQKPYVINKYGEEDGFKINIAYTNGATTFNEEDGYYMPLTEDGISEYDVENFLETIVDFINDELVSIKEYIETIRYETVKNGGELPVASGIYCDNCFEEYICIDEDLAEIGTCLNCGAHHHISRCERCGQYYIDYRHEDIKLCDSCKEYYDNE